MKSGNRIGRRRRFEGPVLALTMSSMRLRVIQQRRRWDLAWWDFAQKLGIAFEQSVDGLGHLVGHAPRSPASWPCRTACARHRGTWLDQPVVELGPFIVPQPDGLEDGEKQHLLHVYETRHLHHCQIICGKPPKRAGGAFPPARGEPSGEQPLIRNQYASVHPHCARHTCAVLSALPEPMRVPSGDHATVHTGPECPR